MNNPAVTPCRLGVTRTILAGSVATLCDVPKWKRAWLRGRRWAAVAVACGLTFGALPLRGANIYTGVIQITDLQTNTVLGYLSATPGSVGLYGDVTSTQANALAVTFNTGSTPFAITLLSPPGGSTPQLGAILGVHSTNADLGTGNFDYVYLGATALTPAGAPATAGANTYPLATEPIESTIWSINSGTNVLSAQWINGDNSAHPLTFYRDTFVSPPSNNPTIQMTGDLSATESASGGEAAFIHPISLTLLNTVYWLGGTNGSWAGNVNNWSSDAAGTLLSGIPIATSDVTFSATGAANQGNTTLDQDFTIHSLIVNDATPVVINSGAATHTLTIAGNAGTGITANDGSSLTINSNVTFGAASDTIATNGAGAVTINGVFAGSNGLIKTGAGTVTLTNNGNTYSGETTINGGTLAITGDGALGSSSNGVTLNGGTLLAISGVTTNRTITLGISGGTIATSGNTQIFLNGQITGNGPLNLSSPSTGSAAIFFSGSADNTFTGLTTVETGFVELDAVGHVALSGDVQVNSTGSLTLNSSEQIADTATVTVNGQLEFFSGSNETETIGTLNGSGKIGSVGSPVATLVVSGGTFSGSIVDSLALGGTMALTKQGTGTLTLTGASTYTGTTDIKGGTLRLDGSLGNTVVTVENSATLAGKGTIAGSVTVASGGNLSPGDSGIGTLTVGALTLNSGAKSNFDLGTPGIIGGTTNDLVKVNGNLTLGGTLNITDAGGFGPGAYRLFNYTGTLTNNTLAMGSLPGTFAAANFTVVTGVPNEIDLIVVPNAGAATMQFWDGAGPINNATIEGGSGTWTNFANNFVDNTGNNNAAWQNGVAVFSTPSSAGASSTVTVSGAINFAGLMFAGGNYTIASDGAPGTSFTAIGTPTNTSNIASIAVSNGVTATIAAPIGGTAGLSKDGPGTLIFTGANTYGGGTTINSGLLLVNNTTGSGTGTGGVAVNSGGALGGNGTVSGAVALNIGGAIAPGAGTPGATLHVGSLTWNGGGQLDFLLGKVSDKLVLTGGSGLTKGTAGTYGIDLEDGGHIPTQSHYQLATFLANNGFTTGDFTLNSMIPGLKGFFTLTGSELDFDITGLTVIAPIIQNSDPVDTPVFADFVVQGKVTTGGPAENNVISTLTFAPGGSLDIHNSLYVTHGPVILPAGASIWLGPGSLWASELELLFGSYLHGNGSIIGNVINGGLISPGNSPGVIHFTGNLEQTPTGTLRIEIGGRDITQHDLLTVGGTAALGGTLQLVRLDQFKLKRNEPVTFLTAGEGVIGKFATVENGFTSDTILEPTVVYHSNRVDLEAIQGSFERFADRAGLTPNQKSVARALDSAANDRRANSLFDYLDYRKLNELPRGFDKIAPEELTSMFTIGVSLATVQSQNIQRRNDDIRSGAGGFNAAGLAVNSDGPSYSGSFFNQGVAGPSGDDGKEIKETKQVTPEEARWGAFLSGTGQWVSVGNTDNARGYNLDSGGFTLGLDYKVTPNLAIGIAGGYTGTAADLNDGGRVYVNGGKLGLYATFFDYQRVKAAPTMSKDSKEVVAPTYEEARGLYADVAVFGGYNSYDMHRSALQGEARGDTDGGELNVLFGAGYDFKKGNLTFGPTASFNYTYLGTNAFTERGSLAPLDVHGGKGESLRTAFGLKASYDWKVGGIVIKPELRAAWQHEYGDAAYALDSSFANGAGDTFRVNGPKLGRDSALLGAGFAIQVNDRWSTYLYYDGELGRTNYHSASVTGGIRLTF